MKVISARQVWHDALHENRASALAVAAEQAALGKKGGSGDVKIMVMLENHDGQEVCKVYEVRKEGVQETRPGRRLTNDRCAHMLTAGLVLQAIDSLPKSLRHLGHFLYSPVASGNDLSISHGLVWLGGAHGPQEAASLLDGHGCAPIAQDPCARRRGDGAWCGVHVRRGSHGREDESAELGQGLAGGMGCALFPGRQARQAGA